MEDIEINVTGKFYEELANKGLTHEQIQELLWKPITVTLRFGRTDDNDVYLYKLWVSRSE